MTDQTDADDGRNKSKRELFDAATEAVQEAAEAIEDRERANRLAEARTEIARVATEELGVGEFIVRSGDGEGDEGIGEVCAATGCENEAVGEYKCDDPAAFERRWDPLCERHRIEAENRGAIYESRKVKDQ